MRYRSPEKSREGSRDCYSAVSVLPVGWTPGGSWTNKHSQASGDLINLGRLGNGNFKWAPRKFLCTIKFENDYSDERKRGPEWTPERANHEIWSLECYIGRRNRTYIFTLGFYPQQKKKCALATLLWKTSEEGDPLLRSRVVRKNDVALTIINFNNEGECFG